MLSRQNNGYPAPGFVDDEAPAAPALPRYHPQGRTAPEPSEPSFDIKVDGVLLGTVYPMRLKGKAQFALERARNLLETVAWMETYAGGDPKQIEAVLGELPIQEILTFLQGINQALTESIALKNPSGPR